MRLAQTVLGYGEEWIDSKTDTYFNTAQGTIDAFKAAWMALGDSIVVVGGDGLWNCHVHTDDIGGAIEAGIEAGRPRNIRVTDLLEQVEHPSPLTAIYSGRDEPRDFVPQHEDLDP